MKLDVQEKVDGRAINQFNGREVDLIFSGIFLRLWGGFAKTVQKMSPHIQGTFVISIRYEEEDHES